MSAQLDELKANVAAEANVVESAVVLLNGISARIDEAIAAFEAGNDAALADLSNEVKASTQALSDAVAANTPAEE